MTIQKSFKKSLTEKVCGKEMATNRVVKDTSLYRGVDLYGKIGIYSNRSGTPVAYIQDGVLYVNKAYKDHFEYENMETIGGGRFPYRLKKALAEIDWKDRMFWHIFKELMGVNENT